MTFDNGSADVNAGSEAPDRASVRAYGLARTRAYVRGALRRFASVGATVALVAGLTVAIATPTAVAATPRFNPGGFEAGNILSDDVLYRSDSMTAKQVTQFVKTRNARCVGKNCLRKLRVDTPPLPADGICEAYLGGARQKVGVVIADVARACGINPQVILVMMQIQSGALSKTPMKKNASYDWSLGLNCPGVGDSDTLACDPAEAGLVDQIYGMAHLFAQYRVNPGGFPHQAGRTVDIAFHADPQCGSAPVTIENAATAALYNYIPQQPNLASLVGYPGLGDLCSSYVIRNFYFIYSQYFGATGGGAASRPVVLKGKKITVPASPFVPDSLAGRVIKAPTKAVARGIAAGFESIGVPYVWGGGTYGGPADQGCARGQRGKNACQGTVGFDCSGLTAYVLKQAGVSIPSNSTGQRGSGKKVKKVKAVAGDIVGYPGHVAVYLGEAGGVKYMLEAPDVGMFVRVATMRTWSADKKLYRYWK